MIATDTLGSVPIDQLGNRDLVQALEAMEDAGEDLGRAAQYARQALEIDPACSSAMLVLAEAASTRAERIALLKEVVSIGKREFQPSACRPIQWWWTPGTRTIMAAIADLGDELAEVGDHEGAAKCYRQLLEMDPSDRMEIRAALREVEGAVSRTP